MMLPMMLLMMIVSISLVLLELLSFLSVLLRKAPYSPLRNLHTGLPYNCCNLHSLDFRPNNFHVFPYSNSTNTVSHHPNPFAKLMEM